jgi:hypothetical protein
MAGAPIGNSNATKNKRWSQAIDKALKQYNEGDVKQGQALDVIAMRLVRRAITTDDDQVFDKAIAVIGDRIEGKPSQSVQHGNDGDSFKVDHKWEIEFVNATPSVSDP